MAGRYCCRDVFPFTALVAMECINVGLNTLFKAATLAGMSHFAFIAYSYGIAALVLLPAPFLSYRSSSQIMGYTGINFSSPTLASAISNLTPAFTFILAIIFRMEKLACRKTSSQAKVLGTIASIAGAFVVTLYKGPRITIISSPNVSLIPKPLLHSSNSNWGIGGLFLTVEYILVPLWYIVQTQIMKEYPAELTVVFLYNLCVTFVAAIVGSLAQRDADAWKVRPGIALASIVCSGLFGSCINNSVHAWALRLKGPFFVAMFKPFSIAIAVAMGVMFLGDTLYLGSLVGATIISLGFYTVMWGKRKEEISEDDGVDSQESVPASQRVALLQNHKNLLV